MTPNLAAYVNKHFWSHGLSASGSRSGWAGGCGAGTLWRRSQYVIYYIIWGFASAGEATSKMVYPHGCWQEPKFLVTGPLPPGQLTSPRRNEMRGQKPWRLLLYHLASGGTLLHDCQILLLTQPSPGRKWEGLIRACVTAGGGSKPCVYLREENSKHKGSEAGTCLSSSNREARRSAWLKRIQAEAEKGRGTRDQTELSRAAKFPKVESPGQQHQHHMETC